jgi:hypothetical protein
LVEVVVVDGVEEEPEEEQRLKFPFESENPYWS